MSIVKLNNEYMLQTLILERAKCKKNRSENIPYQNVKIHDYEEDEYELSISEDIEKHRDIINQEEATLLLELIIETKITSIYEIHNIQYNLKLKSSATNKIIDEENETATIIAYAYDRLIDYYTKLVNRDN